MSQLIRRLDSAAQRPVAVPILSMWSCFLMGVVPSHFYPFDSETNTVRCRQSSRI